MLFRDFIKFIAYTSAVITFILTLGSDTVDLFVKWGIISLADGKITIVPLANNYYYLLAGCVVVIGVLLFMGYKNFFHGDDFGAWLYFFMWLAFVVMIAFMLAEPVPWYGLALGVFTLFLLFWVLFHAVFPSRLINSTKNEGRPFERP